MWNKVDLKRNRRQIGKTNATLKANQTSKITLIDWATPWKKIITMEVGEERPQNQGSKKNLDVIYHVLVPISIVIKTKEHNSIVKDPGKKKVTSSKILTLQNLQQKTRETYPSPICKKTTPFRTGKTSDEKIQKHVKAQ